MATKRPSGRAEVKFRTGVGSPKIVNSGTGTPIGAGNLSVVAGGYLEGAGAPYRDWETDRKSTRLNSSHITRSRMPSSA